MNPSETIESHYLQHNRHIRNDSLAKKLGCTVEEAQKHLDRYRKEHGERVRGQLELPIVEEPKPKPVHLHSVIDWLVDGGALILAVVIDLVLNVVVFVTIAPDPLTKVGMAGLAFLVVLFSVRGWIKGGIE